MHAHYWERHYVQYMQSSLLDLTTPGGTGLGGSSTLDFTPREA